MEYKIAQAQNAANLEAVVNAMIADGWEPLGGVVNGTANFQEVWAQAMTRKAEQQAFRFTKTWQVLPDGKVVWVENDPSR